MKDFLYKLISLLVTNPADVLIREETNNNFITLNITPPSAEMGRVIGKNGNIIRSIRNLLKLKGIIDNKQVVVRLTETQA